MPLFRIYLNRKIDPETLEGGDHTRFLDIAADERDDALSEAHEQIEEHEEVGDVTELAI